jgi:hypothetical protein
MNIQLSGAVEYIDHKEMGTLGQVLIRYFVQSREMLGGVSWHGLMMGYRCNNVLWIQGANQKHENGDVKMEG